MVGATHAASSRESEKECCCHLTCGKGKRFNGPFLLRQDKAIWIFSEWG